MDMELCELILAVEMEHGLHHPDG
jgi:hypothetical protein